MNKEKLNEILNENKYILIDYTEKLKQKSKCKNPNKNAISLLTELEEKVLNPRNDKIVFMIDLNKLKQINSVILMMLINNGFIPVNYQNMIFLKNSENFLRFGINEDVHKNVILNFINTKQDDLRCDICFEKYRQGNICITCNFKNCFECEKKSQKYEMVNNCFGCRKEKINEAIYLI